MRQIAAYSTFHLTCSLITVIVWTEVEGQQQLQTPGLQYINQLQKKGDVVKLPYQVQNSQNNKLQHSRPDIYDFHVPRFIKANTSAVLSCGYLESLVAPMHEIQWLKDDIVFFSYQPSSQQIAHVFLDREWLFQNSLSHMVETINVQGEHRRHTKGFNITVVSLRFQPVTQTLSGEFKCKLSVPLSTALDSSIAYISSRRARLSVIGDDHQLEATAPELGLEKSVGYSENEPIHITCTSRGYPAPYLQWNYVREMIRREDEDEVPAFVDLDILNNLMYSAVGRSRLKNYPLHINRLGLETRTLGLTVICCKQKRFSCALKHEGEFLRTDVEIIEHGDTWRLEIISKEVTTTEPPAPPEEPVTEPVVEELQEEEEEEEDWLTANINLVIGLSVGGALLLILLLLICFCRCVSNRSRRARRKRNKEIRRRQLYENSTRGGGSRGTRLTLSRRSNKRRAPHPLYQEEEEQQQQQQQA